MSDEVAALFPDKFVDSDLGEIPEGWEISDIGHIVDVVGGSTPRTNNPEFWENGTIHWATPRDLASLSDPILTSTDRKITETGLTQISSGLLPVGTVLLSSRAPIGYLVISDIPVAVNQGFIACKIKNVSQFFIKHWIAANMDEIMGRANGTTFLEISKSNFRPIPFLLPCKPILNEFDKIIKPLFDQIINNVYETKELSRTRNYLLPKLLSGEIRLKQAEKIVSEVV